MAEADSRHMVQKTIIANYGGPNLGKTKSIGLAYELLKRVADKDFGKIYVDHDDFCAWMEINGVKVGISSQGDPWSHQKQWLDDLVAKGCDIILAACRHSGATVTVIEDCARVNGYRIYWTSNARIYEAGTNPRVAPKGIRNRFNEQWAEDIANLIDNWCYV